MYTTIRDSVSLLYLHFLVHNSFKSTRTPFAEELVDDENDPMFMDDITPEDKSGTEYSHVHVYVMSTVDVQVMYIAYAMVILCASFFITYSVHEPCTVLLVSHT